MGLLSKLYTFTAGTKAKSAEVNAVFDQIIDFVNDSVVHVDGSKAFTALPALPTTDPTGDNQPTRKAYVDTKVAAAQATADAAQSTANAALPKAKINFGLVNGTTNGAGDFVFAHGLGGTPDAVLVCVASGGSTVNWHPSVEARDATNVNVRIFRTNTSGVIANTPGLPIFWIAIRN